MDAVLSEQVLKEAKFGGKAAEEVIYEKRLADETDVAGVKSELLGAPYKKIDPGLIPDEVLGIIPFETSKTSNIPILP